MDRQNFIIKSFSRQRKPRVKVGNIKWKYANTNACHKDKNSAPLVLCIIQMTNEQLVVTLNTQATAQYWNHVYIQTSTARSKAAADEVVQWTAVTNMALNYAKTNKMCIFFKKKHDIPNCTRLQVVTLSHDLTWKLHID